MKMSGDYGEDERRLTSAAALIRIRIDREQSPHSGGIAGKDGLT
jgi:hypothetical protein